MKNFLLLILPLGLALACQTSRNGHRDALLEDSGLEEVTILAKGIE